MTARSESRGPALLSYGFRPFFLAAILFAFGVIPAWLLAWRGGWVPAGPFLPVDWHIHEMIFGYGAAVVAGFLFTAVPNWTGRMPTRGAPLAALLALWIAGRLAVLGLFGPPVVALAVDAAFLLAVAAMIAREIVAGRNWRNLKVLVPVTLLAAANVGFHAEAMAAGRADVAARAGIAVLVFLIMLIGGRIVPSFTRNWLVQAGVLMRPAPFGRYDILCLGAGALALAAWVAAPRTDAAAWLLGAAAALHFVRLARWLGPVTIGSPLLMMLHMAYAFIPFGLAAAAMAAGGLAEPATGSHLLGIGAVGAMTLAVMIRATLGHTGRELVAGPGLTLAFLLLVLAAVVRVGGASEVLPGIDGIHLAAALWTGGFALALRRMLPWLVSPKVAPRTPRRAPA